ncbi:hypothetical protein HHI36_014757 [Cryptolaemus montrouzieri]|uniref:Uncharacterized protein n=1 Tax=Cryptolaemus montrouzieri TaxID=559131 RepID=A0ABD2N3I9_9CUCU
MCQREKANTRKRKFSENMTPEEREIKRAKKWECYQKKKARNKVIKVANMTDHEKHKQRKQWKQALKKYKEKKKMLANIVRNTHLSSEDEFNLTPEDKTAPRNSAK